MEKPFDSKVLVDMLKEQGLPVAEDAAEKIATAVFAWTEQSLLIHPNQYVKFLGPVVAQLKPLVFEQLEKIDGKVGA